MGHPDYVTCKNCGRHKSEAGTMSWARLCSDCGHERLLDNVDQMHARRGPNWQLWRRQMAACVGATLDDLRSAA